MTCPGISAPGCPHASTAVVSTALADGLSTRRPDLALPRRGVKLSVWDAPCPAAWLQHWLQSWRPGADSRPSCFSGRTYPSWHESCERYALSQWSLLLLSRLLSAAIERTDISVLARIMQGMARVRSGQASAWPLVSDRSVRRGSRVKRDIACTLTRHFPPVLVVLPSQSRLRLEGRTRTLSGPSPELSPAETLAPPAVMTPPYARVTHSHTSLGYEHYDTRPCSGNNRKQLARPAVPAVEHRQQRRAFHS